MQVVRKRKSEGERVLSLYARSLHTRGFVEEMSSLLPFLRSHISYKQARCCATFGC